MHGPLNVKFTLLGAFAKLRKVTISFVTLNLSVRIKHWYLSIFRKSIEKIQFHENLTRITRILHAHLHTLMIIPHSFLLRMKNVPHKICTGNQNTHFIFSNVSRKSCPLWDNVKIHITVGQATNDNVIRRMRFACWITEATVTHSEYVILIGFSRQHRLRERAPMLRLYVNCLSCWFR
jgi:hypothetical protein